MYIVLDSSILISEDFGRSSLLQFLLSSSNVLGHRICICDLTKEEVSAEHGRVLDRESKRVRDGLRALSKLLGEELKSPTDELDTEAKTGLFRERLEAQFTEPNCEILDYPDVSNQEMVKRAIARRKPFDNRGSGFRDALIWYSMTFPPKTVSVRSRVLR